MSHQKREDCERSVLSHDKDRGGFSLIELIVTVLIIGILIAIAIPLFLNTQDEARQSAVEATASSALAPVQEAVLSGETEFNDVLASFETDDISLSIVENNFVQWNPDTVCVQANWLDASNEAAAGACMSEDSASGSAGESEEEVFEDNQLVFTIDTTLPECTDPGIPDLRPVMPNRGEIDWGDGNKTTVNFGINSYGHSYENDGVYDVIVTGKIESFGNIAHNSKPRQSCLVALKHWGNDVGVNTVASGFYNATNLIQVDSPPENNSITSMTRLFANASSFDQDLNDWDVSNVRDMSRMFQGAESFNGNIGDWQLDSVNNMAHMFNGASSFNQDISSWKFPNATSLSGFFQDASSFNQDISDWNISNIETLAATFRGASSFDQDLSDWNTSKVRILTGTFRQATSFNGDLSRWDTSNVTNMQDLFWGASSFNQPINTWFDNEAGETYWDVSSVGTALNGSMSSMFRDASSFNQALDQWDTSNVRFMPDMFRGESSFVQDISGWDVSSVSTPVGGWQNITLPVENRPQFN